MSDPTLDPRFTPAVDLLRRTGLRQFWIGHAEEDDEEMPVVWYATGVWDDAVGGGREAAGALDPVTALFRLCEIVIDGGRCMHCGKPTSFTPEHEDAELLEMLTCTYSFDPELNTFRRTCEGDTT